jgi:hypothetical protein
MHGSLFFVCANYTFFRRQKWIQSFEADFKIFWGVLKLLFCHFTSEMKCFFLKSHPFVVPAKNLFSLLSPDINLLLLHAQKAETPAVIKAKLKLAIQGNHTRMTCRVIIQSRLLN